MTSRSRASRAAATVAIAMAAVVAMPSRAAEPDPYAASTHDALEALLRAATFGEPGADGSLRRWLREHPDAVANDRGRVEHRLCADASARSQYAVAAVDCAASRDLGLDDAEKAANGAALARTPPPRAVGSARVPLTANGLGSRDAVVAVHGIVAAWLVDTGAQISVVSASLAAELAVEPVGGDVVVGSTTGAVTGHLAVIDLLRIGDAAIENVAVLVLPDAQLAIGDLPPIRAILGLPVFVALRRIAWLDGGSTLALGDAAPRPPVASPRPYWHEQGVGVPIATSRGTRGAHLDTGENDSYLRAPAHALLDRTAEDRAVVRAGRMGGAGGVVETSQKVYPTLSLRVADVAVTLHDVSIDDSDDVSAARLGDDILRAMSSFALDFETMRVSATPRRP